MSFPKDIIILLALELDDPSIINLCRSSKRYNEAICKNQNFWKLKIEKERPGVLETMEGEITNYRELYQDLQKDFFSISYERFDIFNIVKGYLEDYGFTPLYYDDEYKIGNKVWVVVGNEEVISSPIITKSRDEALKIIKREIEHIHDDLTSNGYDLKELEYYYKELEETNRVKIDDFTFAMEDLKIL